MAMTTIEGGRRVTGGVDTHGEVHVAAVVDQVGGLLGTEAFPVSPAGYAALHQWLCRFGELTTVGVEGTGAYGAGLARFLRHSGVVVAEVDRPQPPNPPAPRQIRPSRCRGSSQGGSVGAGRSGQDERWSR
jgi:hypothetical protein